MKRWSDKKEKMYEKFANQVRQFDAVFNCHLPDREKITDQLVELGVPREKVTTQAIKTLAELNRRAMFGARLGLIIEEAGEWAEAFLKEKPQDEQDKELADLAYVVIGTGDVLGSPDFEQTGGALERVMQKNQKKIDDPSKMKIGANGKIIKPEDQNS